MSDNLLPHDLCPPLLPPPDSEDEEDQLTLIRHHHGRLRHMDTKRIPSYPWNHIVNKCGACPLSSQFEFEDWKNNNKQVWNQACLDHHLNFGDPSPWKTINDRLHEEESRWRSFETSVKDSSIALQCYLRDAFLERNRPAFDIVRICDRNDFKYFDPIVCSLCDDPNNCFFQKNRHWLIIYCIRHARIDSSLSLLRKFARFLAPVVMVRVGRLHSDSESLKVTNVGSIT